jgi:hypothetical protein
MHYIELGQTYAQMGKTADARRMIVKGLAMPDVDKETNMTPRSSVADGRRWRNFSELSRWSGGPWLSLHLRRLLLCKPAVHWPAGGGHNAAEETGSALARTRQQGRLAGKLRQPGFASESLGSLEESMAMHKKMEALCLELDKKYGLQADPPPHGKSKLIAGRRDPNWGEHGRTNQKAHTP